MGRQGRYSPEVRERAVRMVFDQEVHHSSHTKGFRFMMAAGAPWGRAPLAEAASLRQNPPILMLSRPSSLMRWRLSGKSRIRRV